MNQESLQRRFTACYEAEADSIFRFCLVRVSDREQALDIVQETFSRMWQTVSRGTRIDNEKAFLFTVAHRLIIDWYRKKKAVSFSSVEDALNPDNDGNFEPADGKDYADLEMDAEGRYLLVKLREMSPGNRQAVYLRFVEGLAPPDIGEILGITANAASVRINRGLQELRRLAGYDSPSGKDQRDKRERHE